MGEWRSCGRTGGSRTPALMGTIVKGQSRAILPVRFPRCLGSSVHRCLSAKAICLQKSLLCLTLIRNAQTSPRLHIIIRLQRCNLGDALNVQRPIAHSSGTGHRDFMKLGASANDLIRLVRNPFPDLRDLPALPGGLLHRQVFHLRAIALKASFAFL